MISGPTPMDEALRGADRGLFADRVAAVDAKRAELLRLFPRDSWASMSLEQYALGHERAEDSYCRWIEFKSPELGSISGGSARKLIIYKRRNAPGWFFPKMFSNEQEAWSHLRRDFLSAFELADAKRWNEIDELEALSWGPVLKLKTLHLYFPEDILPVYSINHLRHFLRLLKHDQDAKSSAPIQLNRSLLEALHRLPELATWSTTELARFLYSWAHPREARRVFKIAPGENAKYWEECLAGGYICVGWDRSGDLREYDSKKAFRERLGEVYADQYRDKKSKLTEKSNEVWTLVELEPGDLVVANQGTSRVLAVGEVVEPGYVFRDDREHFKHTVTVKWDTSYAKTIPAQARWAFVTVASIPDDLLETILSTAEEGALVPMPGDPTRTPVPPPPLYLRIANALERKGQVILYGPPGTGKTYSSERFAAWWLLRKASDREAESILGSSERIAKAKHRLATATKDAKDVPRLTRVTFHPSYTYEDFIEGFRPTSSGAEALSLRLDDGIFKRVCRAAAAHPDDTYLVLIDEINRGNVAKILGELLTLLELDKRGLSVALPQSKQEFAVPPNVFVLGTMNTADRSIKLLDAALRRRFAFIELMPDIELLRGVAIGPLRLDEFLIGLNRRIAREEGREKQIGHSYLLDGGQPIADAEDFASAFREEILPLLQEYCYDEYPTLARYIGAELVDIDGQQLVEERLADPEQLLATLAEEFEMDDGGASGSEPPVGES